jgi:hypothetical protein
MLVSLFLFTAIANKLSWGLRCSCLLVNGTILHLLALPGAHRFVPRSAFWRNMRQHPLAAQRNYWLSFTVTGMDTLMGTNPV